MAYDWKEEWAKDLKYVEKNYSKVFSLRNFLAEEIQKIQGSLINTNLDKSSPYILNLSFSEYLKTQYFQVLRYYF